MLSDDELLQEADELRYKRNAQACDAHLSDLRAVYGAPRVMVQPESYGFGRFGPRPGPTLILGQEILATVSI
jgi:hypothetical protein